MKAYYQTWKRGNQEQTFVYHGQHIYYDTGNAVLVVEKPVLESGLGLVTIVPVLNTDEVTVERCEDCAWHRDLDTERIPENLVV